MTNSDSPRRIAEGVAHDLYHTFGIIKNNLTFLRRDLSPASAKDERVKDDIEAITEATRQGEELARALMLFSHAQEPSPTIFNLNDLVTENLTLMRGSLPAVEVAYDLDPNLPTVKADRVQVQQALWNLVINAKDAMCEKGGLLTLKTFTHVNGDGQYRACLQVEDNGPGIPAELHEAVFQPFFTTKAGDQGPAGLGLATVYGVVTRAGGEVILDSAPEQGTRFTLRLPAGVIASHHPMHKSRRNGRR